MKHRTLFLAAAVFAAVFGAPAPALRANDPADTPPAAPSAPAADTTAPAPAEVAAPTPEVEAPQPAAPAVAAPAAPAWVDRGEVFALGSDVVIRANERASEVVAVGGNVTVLGRVDGEVFAVVGDVKIDGPVGGEVVAVLGRVELGAKGSVGGEVVSIGGGVRNPDSAPIGGNQISIAPFLPKPWALLRWAGDFVSHVRLLSPQVLWPWYVFGAGALLYLLLAAAFGRGVNACVQSLEERPGATLTTALALLPLLPLFTLLLICTGVGIVLLPFLAVAVLFGFAFGKTAVLAFLGRVVLRPLGGAVLADRAWLAVLVGIVIAAVLYCVPWLGLLAWALLTWIGLGMVAAALLENRRREKAAAAAARAAAMPARAATAAAMAVAPDASGFAAGAAASAPADPATVPPVSDGAAGVAAVPPAPPVLVAAMGSASVETSFPRAEFGVRLGALLIDIVLVAVATGVTVVLSVLPFPLVFGVYAFGMWLWKGTTIGGIVFDLKVVRLDGRPIDAATAVVRTLVAFLSVCAAGLGFLWCLWDLEKQTWHDKVAGTVVVRVPKSKPLV